MDELLQKVAEIRGMPASLVERSAQARAKKTDSTVEAVLLEWLGEADAAAESVADRSEPATEPSGPQPPEQPSETHAQESVSSAEITTDELVQLAAEVKRMPPKLILTSAQARAQHSGATLESVLTSWAGVDLDKRAAEVVVGDSDATTNTSESRTATDVTSTPEPTPEPSSQPAQVTPAVTGGMSMDELLAKVAEVKGMPAPLAKRSADARSKKTGESVESVLAEWAGLTPSPSTMSPSPDASTSAVAKPDAASQPPRETDDHEEIAPAVEIIEAIAPDDAAGDGTDERDAPTRGGYPKWLAAVFLLIPILAVTYILVAPNGPDCGSGGRLRVDPATGEAVNCDGGSYGETAVDNFAAGGAIYAQCAACHSANGSGGVGPAFAGGAVLATFPSGACNDHIEWVTIGTAGWPQPTYGAGDKPVGGVGLMPGFGSFLSEEQVAQVALYERVQFGGQPLDEAEVDCGLVEASTEG